MANLLFFDSETYSEADLPTVGAYEYSKHPTTEVVCAAWRLSANGDALRRQTQTYCGLLGLNAPGEYELKSLLKNPSVLKVAHNANFDRLIVENVMGIPQPIESWVCTAAMAASHALPRSLEGACDVLKLKHRKNPDGKLLVRQLSMPRKPTKKDPSTRCIDPEKLERFVKYCADDVDAMIELFRSLPLLSNSEEEVYKLNQRINHRGVNTDSRLVKCALKMIDLETKSLNAEAHQLTDGKIESANQRAKVLEILLEGGCSLPNLQKKTVEDALKAGLVNGKLKRLLEIRQAISKTSTAKYLAFEARTRVDGRVRDLQLYHGASTGRESGMGLQPHNLPKPCINDVPSAIEAIRSGDITWVRAVSGDVMEALSSSIRGVLVASEGFEMFAADFNAVEARGVLWLAGDTAGLAEFEAGDPYKAEAAGIYQKRVDQISDFERAVGKAIVLGSGFGMGSAKFFLTCKQKGMEVSKDLAERAIASYRKKHPLVVQFWANLERAAIHATQNPGQMIRTNKTAWQKEGKFLYCVLPSGRRIAYFGPEVRTEMTPWGDPRPKLYRWYMDSVTRQWKCGGTYGGELTENVTQAICRDLMVDGQLRTEKLGYIPLISVHDELVAERPRGQGSVSEFTAGMGVIPTWAKGFAVKVAGWKDVRYHK